MLAGKGLDMVWVGSYGNGWRMIRHELTGAPLGRRAQVGYIFRHEQKCVLGSAKIKQEYVAGGQFGPTSLVEMEHGFEVTFKAGDPIECSAGAQAKFGYSR